jgi:hypothetical protein
MAEPDDGQTDSRAAYAASVKKPSDREYLVKLRRILATRFSDGELRTLCFDLGVDYESLPGEATTDKARELIAHLERHDRIPHLVAIGKESRSEIEWGHPSEAAGAASAFHKGTGTPRYRHGQTSAAGPAAGASRFARTIYPDDQQAFIIQKMSKTVSELDAYIEQYGRVISAHRLSAILRERVRKLRSFQSTDPGWDVYWEAVEPIYDELASLAFGMTAWKEARRLHPQREFSDITTEVRTQFLAREESILELVERYTQAHASVQRLSTQLRRSQVDQDGQASRELEEQVKEMHASADIMGRQLYPIINQLIKKELSTLLAELGRPQRGG